MLDVCVYSECALKRTDDAFLMKVGAIYFVAVSYNNYNGVIKCNVQCTNSYCFSFVSYCDDIAFMRLKKKTSPLYG